MKKATVIALMAAMSASVLSGCGGGSSSAPSDLTFNTEDGTFSFDTVKDADTYTVGVSKVLNDTTGEALQGINGAVETEIGKDTCYIWSEQAGSCSGLSDTDGDGVVDGTVVFREYSSSASTVGDVMNISDLGIGHYIVQAVAASNDKVTDPEPAIYEFTIGGTLEEPTGFTAQVNDEGYMEITAPSDYYLSCLSKTGLPEEMKFEISDGSSVVETIEMDDFSYTNTVNGPSKGFTFTNQTVTGTTKLDDSKEYSVTVTAVGDGDEIKDSSAEAYVASSSAEAAFASEYSVNSSGEAGDYSVELKVGEDASGQNIYELDAKVNDVVILRETGTYTANAQATDADDGKTYAEGTQVTFKMDSTDADASVLDGKTLTVTKAQQQGGMPGQEAKDSYYLAGSGLTLNGTEFEFTGGISSMPMMGP